MSFKRGMYRVGIVLGVIGATVGVAPGYRSLTEVWDAHTRFERLQSLPVMQAVLEAAKEYKQGWTDVSSGAEPIPKGATIGKSGKHLHSSKDFLAGAQKVEQSSGKPASPGFGKFGPPEPLQNDSNGNSEFSDYDTVSVPIPSGGSEQFGVRRSDWLDRNAPGVQDPQMELTVKIEGHQIDTANMDKNGSISSIQLASGEWVSREPKTFKAHLLFASKLLGCLLFPALGFLIPWGAIRVFVWVSEGFSTPPASQ